MKIIFKKRQWFTVITALCLAIVTLFAVGGCNTSETPSANEDIDPTLLVGEWDCIKFAYIAEDNTISDVNTLSNGYFVISDISNSWTFFYRNEWRVERSISKNLIDFSLISHTFAMVLPDEEEVVSALENAYSFAIKGNELMIYFSGVESKNLLIFQKR